MYIYIYADKPWDVAGTSFSDKPTPWGASMAAFGTAGRGFDAIASEDAFDKVTFRSPCTLLTDDVETVVKEPVFVLAFALTTLFDGDMLVSG